jgi:hypothetical protein
MAQLNFDARTVAPDTGGADPVPAGWYNVAIDESGKKPTNDGQGAYLETRYNVLDGQYAGRKLFHRFNTENHSQKAVEIAYKQLSALCHATGVMVVQDSQQLHNIPLKVKVSLREARTVTPEGGGAPKTYDASNEIKAWKNINEPTDVVPAGAAPMGGVPAGFGMAPQAAAPMGWAPQQQPVQQQPQQPAQAQPWQQPSVAQQPAAAQPWQPQAPQQPAAAPQQAPVQQPWQPQQLLRLLLSRARRCHPSEGQAYARGADHEYLSGISVCAL